MTIASRACGQTPYKLLANSDAGLRALAAGLLRVLLEGEAPDAASVAPPPTPEQLRKRSELIAQYAAAEPEKVAAFVAGANAPATGTCSEMRFIGVLCPPRSSS